MNKASKPYPLAPNDPFPLTPLLQLPAAFGAAYVGTTFSCTLCANNELPPSSSVAIRNVQISAELQAPGGATPLELSGQAAATAEAVSSGETVQSIVRHDLREDGPHVLAVTVTYAEVDPGQEEERRRTFRKLYQFVAQPAVGVRTKISEVKRKASRARMFVLEAQLENLTETTVMLDTVTLNLAQGLARNTNWEAGLSEKDDGASSTKPVLAPQDVMQVAFVLDQIDGKELDEKRERVLLAQVHIDWRGPMGEKGELTTGWLGCKGGK